MGKYALLLVKIYVNMNIVEHTSSGLGDTERDLCACISVCDCVCENKCYLDHRNTFFFSIMILQVFSMCNVCVSVCVCVCLVQDQSGMKQLKLGVLFLSDFLSECAIANTALELTLEGFVRK